MQGQILKPWLLMLMQREAKSVPISGVIQQQSSNANGPEMFPVLEDEIARLLGLERNLKVTFWESRTPISERQEQIKDLAANLP